MKTVKVLLIQTFYHSKSYQIEKNFGKQAKH